MLWCCENFVPLGQLIAISMPRQPHEHSRFRCEYYDDYGDAITRGQNYQYELQYAVFSK